MGYAVTNVFEWTGFLIADYLLSSGQEVVGSGIAETDDQKFLEMFFGRNASFQRVDQLDFAMDYDAVFDAADEQAGTITFEPATRIFTIGKNPKNGSPTEKAIQIPMLIGKWMPMNEAGVFVQEQFIPFTSEKFQASLFVHSMVSCLLQLLAAGKYPETMKVRSKGSQLQPNEAEQTIFVRDDPGVEQKKQQLLENYDDHPEYFRK